MYMLKIHKMHMYYITILVGHDANTENISWICACFNIFNW